MRARYHGAQVIQAVGLGYGRPAAGLMQRKPRPPGQPILGRGLLIWLVIAGLVIAAGSLSVISWAQQAHGLVVARTMGLVTLSLFNLFFSTESKDYRRSAFNLDSLADKTFIITTATSFSLLVLATVLGPFHSILKTTTLDVPQWLVCTCVSLSIIVVAEIRKAIRRRSSLGASRQVDEHLAEIS